MRKITLVCAVMAIGVLLAGGIALAKKVQGTQKNDTLRGTTRGDLIYGFGGDDTILGKNDELYGGPGKDSISGDEDDAYGGSGNDEVRSGNGQDDIYGGDYYSGGNNNDTINSKDNRPDTVSCGLGLDDQVLADKDLDAVYSDCERVTEK